MSFKVLVIPEDPTHNGAILRPLAQALLVDAGKPQAKVTVLDNPRVRGFDNALATIRGDLAERYGWMDLWVFFPDADRAMPQAMSDLGAGLAARGVRLLCCAAQPEVEIYACAAWRAEMPGGWEAGRTHRRFKEDIFDPLLAVHGDTRRPSGGRDLMIDASLANLPLLLQLCPELKTLRDRLAAADGG